MTVNVTRDAINVREKLAELDKPTGIAGEAMLRAETPQEQFQLIGAGRRNLIINGDFQVSQRGDYSSATAATSNNYYLDRFKIALALASATVQHNEVVLPNGIKTMAMKVAATSDSSGGYVGVRHVIEDFRVLSGQVVTVSMWVRTTLKDLTFRHDSTTNFGDTIVPDGEWHYHTATYQMPTITAAGGNANQTTLAIINYSDVLAGGAGTKNGQYFELAQVQLELGKVATPFEHRSYGEELALCQRYYYKIDMSAAENILPVAAVWSSNVAYGQMPFPVEMRAVPSFVYPGGNNFIFYSAGSSAVVNYIASLGSTKNFWGVHYASANTNWTAGNAVYGRRQTTSAYLSFDAEL